MGRRAIVLLVALVLAGLAAWAVWNFLQSVEQEAEAGQQQVDVFRAGDQNIQEGTQGDVLITDFSAGGTLIQAGTDEIEDVPADAIQTADELREVLGSKVAAGPISGNQRGGGSPTRCISMCAASERSELKMRTLFSSSERS